MAKETGAFIIRSIDKKLREKFRKTAMYSGMSATEAFKLYMELVVEGKFTLPKKE